MSAPLPPRITVIAGVNGSGKSSVVGATIRSRGGLYYNPDEKARQLMTADPALTQAQANSAAWQEGVQLLQRAITERLDFVFETTLGGNTIARLLAEAASQGIEIHVWYVGLSSPELHIQRVQSRVHRKGHDIPEEDIRRRYKHSRNNLIALLPVLASLRVDDNSEDADPADGYTPKPKLILRMEHGKIIDPPDIENIQNPENTPDWAKPIVDAAIRCHQRQ